MKYIRFLFLMFLFSCASHSGPENKMILGKWKGDKRVFIFDGDTTSVLNNLGLQHIFFTDTTWWGFADAKGYEIYEYEIKGKELIINDQDFEIIKLDENYLIYKTWRDSKIDVVVDSFIKVDGNDW